MSKKTPEIGVMGTLESAKLALTSLEIAADQLRHLDLEIAGESSRLIMTMRNIQTDTLGTVGAARLNLERLIGWLEECK